MIKAIKYLLFLTILSLSKLAMSLTLMEAEKKAFASSYKIKSFSAEKSSLDYQKDKISSSLMPTLGLEYSKNKATYPEKNNFNNLNTTVRANFSNPFAFSAQRQQIDTSKKLVDLNITNHKHHILQEIRLYYFKAKFLQEQVEQAKRHLETIEKVASISEKKYKQGLIPILHKERSILEKTKQNQTINALKEGYKGQVSLLAISTDKKDLQARSLVTPLPESVNFSSLPSAFQPTYLTKKLELQNEQIKNNISLDRSKLFPDFYLAYQQNRNIDQERSSSYLVGVTWKLSSERYFSHRSLEMEKEAKSHQQKDATRNDHLRYTDLISQIRSISTKLSSQKEIANTRKKIAKESLNQYNKGIITLKDYYEDFSLLIIEERTLLQFRFEAVNLLASLSFLLEDENVFYKSLKL